MIKRVPILPTLVVAAAVALMIGLGVWQLQRAKWKDSLLAQYSKADALPPIAFPTVPKVAIASNPDSSSLANFLLFIQNTDPGSNAGVPGIQLPIALGASSKLPVGLELDGPAGSDRKLLTVGMAMEKIFGRLPPPSR